jgi:hypothetical protein
MLDKKCVIEYFKGIQQEVKELNDRLYTIDKSDNIMYVFTFLGDWFALPIVNGKREIKSQGTWECKGNNHYIVTTDTHTWASDGGGWVEKPQSTAYSIQFSCIQKNKGNAAKIDSNGDYVWFWVDEPDKVAHIFFKDGKWSQTKNNINQFTGRWNCDEGDHFLIVTDDKSYSSRNDNWEKITKVGDSNDSFPLKFGSKGPNVVKLQKFLNNKISANPLTVNGIFDQKTQDKLIEFQKKEGIIE